MIPCWELLKRASPAASQLGLFHFYAFTSTFDLLIGLIRFADDPQWGVCQKNPDVYDICHFPFKDQFE